VTAGPTAEILPFRDAFAPDFDRLNREWLTRYFSVEPLDEEYLLDPWGKILAPGGEIFFARLGEEVVGTCAAVPEGEQCFELVKLAVAPKAQGRGIGRLLVQRVIDYVRERGARRIVLWSASKLGPAVRIYEALGFVHTPFAGPPPYDDPQVDIYMTLELEAPHAGA
jgi:GNAT superfamily N-acetyltransferase